MRTRLLRVLSLLLVLCLTVCVPVYAGELNWAQTMVGVSSVQDWSLTGEGIVIGLIDSGISDTYAASLNVQTGTNYLVSESSPFRHDTDDSVGHGTNVASILGDPKIGLVPDATLIPLRCFSSSSGSYDPIIEALYDAVDVYHCDVVNMSLGGKPNNPELAAAVEHALDNGVILIAAAGNVSASTGNDAYYYPASYDGVIAVGSVDSSAVISSKSVQNDRVWVTAPGSSVPVYSRYGYYTTNSGTSIASPFVAAAAALARSVDPDLTPAEFADLLSQTAEDLGAEGKDNAYGYGLLDLEQMLKALCPIQWGVDLPSDGDYTLLFPGCTYYAVAAYYDAAGKFQRLQMFSDLAGFTRLSPSQLAPPEDFGSCRLLICTPSFVPLYSAQNIPIQPAAQPDSQ